MYHANINHNIFKMCANTVVYMIIYDINTDISQHKINISRNKHVTMLALPIDLHWTCT